MAHWKPSCCSTARRMRPPPRRRAPRGSTLRRLGHRVIGPPFRMRVTMSGTHTKRAGIERSHRRSCHQLSIPCDGSCGREPCARFMARHQVSTIRCSARNVHLYRPAVYHRTTARVVFSYFRHIPHRTRFTIHTQERGVRRGVYEIRPSRITDTSESALSGHVGLLGARR